MSLGFDAELDVFNLNDSAELVAVLYNAADEPFAADDLVSVSFEIALPDNTRDTVVGVIEANGNGTGVYNGTAQVGEYTVVATFTTLDGLVKSVRADFEVIDPFASVSPSPSYIVAHSAWMKIEDCFDAEDEGPWLRDMTRNFFNKDKMEHFIDEALFYINQANPPTTLAIGSFVASTTPPTPTVDLPLLAQGTFLAVLRHLIRSYVEQANPVGSQIAWLDRRDYLTRWQSVLQIEQAAFDKMLALYKRRYLNLGQTRLLVASKAGRLLPAPMRTRNIGRGFW